jgi:hypothetical protein
MKTKTNKTATTKVNSDKAVELMTLLRQLTNQQIKQLHQIEQSELSGIEKTIQQHALMELIVPLHQAQTALGLNYRILKKILS